MKRLLILEVIILLIAAGFRLYDLNLKPPHFDEGVNGFFVDQIKSTGVFKYDPTNYHGPLHMYALFGAQSMLGREPWVLRLPVALVGIASVAFLLWGWRRLLTTPARLIAGLLLAISPAAVFVGRYAIHETWLVLALLLFAAGAAEWWYLRSRRAIWWTWLGFALAALTKETWIIHLGCFLVALGVVALLNRFFTSDPPPETEPSLSKPHLIDHLLAPLTALMALVVFYSGFGFHWEGVVDFFRAFAVWAETGTAESGHEDDWHYWLELLVTYEWAVLAALAGSAFYLFKGSGILRWLAASAFGVFLVYTLIPYKTPWCLVSMAWPYAILGGDLAVRLGRIATPLVPAALLLVATGHDAWKAWDLNFVRYDDPDEEYVYVQTKRGYRNYLDPLLDSARERPQLYGARGVIVIDSVHPLPWVLGNFYNIGYYNDELPDLSNPPDFLLINQSHEGKVNLGPDYWRVQGPLRDGMGNVVGYFRQDRFPAPAASLLSEP